MEFRLEFQSEAEEALVILEKTNFKKHRKVFKTLALLSTNLRYPELQTHTSDSLEDPNKNYPVCRLVEYTYSTNTS